FFERRFGIWIRMVATERVFGIWIRMVVTERVFGIWILGFAWMHFVHLSPRSAGLVEESELNLENFGERTNTENRKFSWESGVGMPRLRQGVGMPKLRQGVRGSSV